MVLQGHKESENKEERRQYVKLKQQLEALQQQKIQWKKEKHKLQETIESLKKENESLKQALNLQTSVSGSEKDRKEKRKKESSHHVLEVSQDHLVIPTLELPQPMQWQSEILNKILNSERKYVTELNILVEVEELKELLN